MSLRRTSFVALLPFLLLGCGGPPEAPKAVIRGKLLDGGKPFAADAVKVKMPKGATALPPGTQPLKITFIPEDRGEMYLATITDQATASFELTGTDGKGVRLGKYKVSVQINTGPGTPDALNGKYSPGKSTIVVELKDGEEAVIDLSKQKG